MHKYTWYICIFLYALSAIHSALKHQPICIYSSNMFHYLLTSHASGRNGAWPRWVMTGFWWQDFISWGCVGPWVWGCVGCVGCVTPLRPLIRSTKTGSQSLWRMGASSSSWAPPPESAQWVYESIQSPKTCGGVCVTCVGGGGGGNRNLLLTNTQRVCVWGIRTAA